jgi:hypothetical protein
LPPGFVALPTMPLCCQDLVSLYANSVRWPGMQTTCKLRETGMNDSLRSLVAAAVVSEREARAAAAWAHDVAELAPRVPRRPEHVQARGRTSSASRAPNVMRVGSKRRLAKVEAALAGKGSPWFRAAHLVAVKGEPAVEAAKIMDIKLAALLLLLQTALVDIASIYGMAEAA